MRTMSIRLAWLMLAALLLVACTRDRETPTPTPSTPTAGTAAAATSAPKSEPVVETSGKTPTPAATEATAAATEAPAGKTFDYPVAPGDTLALIADKFQTTVQTLRELNFLLDDNIFAGQVLAIPWKEGMTAEGAPTPTPTPFVYVVQPGDSLSSIAIEFNIKPITIVEVNNLENPNNLAVGTALLIPGYVAPATTTTANGDNAGATPETGGATGDAGTGASGGDAVVHVVQPGESLGQIAAEYGVDPVALAEANGISNGNLIRVGQKLTIPGITQHQALQARGTRHVVETGESLSAIAEQYGVTVEAILALNGLDDPNKIVVGQELLIPPPN